MLCPPHTPAPIVQDWLERHQHRGSFLLHMIGIPMAVIGVLLSPIYLALLSVPIFLFALGLFIGGYLFQFLGHALEWTEPGEITAIRLWLARLRDRRADQSRSSPQVSQVGD